MAAVVIISSNDWESIHSRLTTMQKQLSDLQDYIAQSAGHSNVPDLANSPKATDVGYAVPSSAYAREG